VAAEPLTKLETDWWEPPDWLEAARLNSRERSKCRTTGEDEHEATARSEARVRRKLLAQQKALREGLMQLTPKQRFVIERRIGLHDGTPYSFGDLAEHMGITPQAVQQIEKDARARLKTVLEPRLCAVCQEPLTGLRSDATTCSAACRKGRAVTDKG
jgi:DNA-directed RNA polymerase specialized sigma subunit